MTLHAPTKTGLLLILGIIFLMLNACRKVEVGIEEASKPNHAATETLTALQNEVDRLQNELNNLTEAEIMSRLGKVAYVQGGDIWTKILPDGQPQRLTNDGRSTRPKWSPSGNWLAFQKGDPVFGQLWLISSDGTLERRVNLAEYDSITNFAWSPVNDVMAYATLSGGLWLTSADGSSLVQLIAPETNEAKRVSSRVWNFAWSPNGQWIGYEWFEQGVSTLPNHQSLRKVEVATGQQLKLYELPDERILELIGWSPQGTRLLFWQHDLSSNTGFFDGVTLYAIYADAELAKNQTPEIIGTAPMLPYVDFVAPAPANSIWGSQDEIALVVGVGTLTTVSKRVEVAGLRLSLPDFAAIHPAWSPDGTWLAYSAMRSKSAPQIIESGPQEFDPNPRLLERRIWITDSLGSGTARQLTNDPLFRDERPFWSMDGSFILFARINGEGQASLWLVRATGGVPRQVVPELTPSPDLDDYDGGYVEEWNTLFDWWRGETQTFKHGFFPAREAPTPNVPSLFEPTLVPLPSPPMPTLRPILGKRNT